MSGMPTSAGPPGQRRSNNGGARIAGEMNRDNSRIQAQQLLAIKNNWHIQDIQDFWNSFPEEIHPKEGNIGLSALQALKRISDTVSLQEAQRLITDECTSGETTTRVGYTKLSRAWDRLKHNPRSRQPMGVANSSSTSSQSPNSNLEGNMIPTEGNKKVVTSANSSIFSHSAQYIAPKAPMTTDANALDAAQELPPKVPIPPSGSLTKNNNNNLPKNSTNKKRKNGIPEGEGTPKGNKTNRHPSKKVKPSMNDNGQIQQAKSTNIQDTQINRNLDVATDAKKASEDGDIIMNPPKQLPDKSNTGGSDDVGQRSMSPHTTKMKRLDLLMAYNKSENEKIFHRNNSQLPSDFIKDGSEETIIVEYPGCETSTLNQNKMTNDTARERYLEVEQKFSTNKPGPVIGPRVSSLKQVKDKDLRSVTPAGQQITFYKPGSVEATEKITDVAGLKGGPRLQMFATSTNTATVDLSDIQKVDQDSAQKPVPELTIQELTVEEKHLRREKEILFLRYKLQQGLLTRDQESKEEMKQMSEFVTKLEDYEDIDVSIIRVTKINKILKSILRLKNIPQDDEFHFRTRFQTLHNRWNKLLAGDRDTPVLGPITSNDNKAKSENDKIDGAYTTEAEERAEGKDTSHQKPTETSDTGLRKQTKGFKIVKINQNPTTENFANTEKDFTVSCKPAIGCDSLREMVRKDQLGTVEELKKTIDQHVNRLQVDIQWIIDRAATELKPSV
ncbi:hypothetical protein B7463_g8687, partial [Scytalidium lignicola]